MLTLGLAAIVKDEADSLLEWIAYHRVVGVDQFFIANNDSTDGTREMLSALQAGGIVNFIDTPTISEKKPQLPAYASLLALAQKRCDLLAFIDADEFIVSMDDSVSIKPFIQKIFAAPDVSALALNWANFGSSGAVFIEDGLVIDRFTQRAKKEFSVHHHYKTIVRPENAVSFLNPHHANINYGRYVDAHGDELIPHAKHGHGLSDKAIWNGVRINHYATKSLEEFLLGKSRRGSASKEGRIKHKRYFLHHDRNDEQCLLAKKFSAATNAEIDRLATIIAKSYETQATQATPAKHAISRLINWK